MAPISDVAGKTVDALKEGNPATFAMIVMCFGLLGFVWYQGSSFESSKSQLVNLILEHQRETSAMLGRCVEPAQVELIIRQLEVNRTSYNDAVEKSYAQSRQNGSELAQILELLKKPIEERH
jgi:hypothetical protein